MKIFTNTLKMVALCFAATSLVASVSAQSVWTGGAGTTHWNTPGNWSGGVPAAGKTVTINACTVCPLITTSGNQSAFVQVYAGGKLGIGAGGLLSISNPDGPGLKTHATSQVSVGTGGKRSGTYAASLVLDDGRAFSMWLVKVRQP